MELHNIFENLQYTRGEDVSIKDNPSQPSVYANLCGVTLTPDEAVLQFAERNPTSPLEATGVVRVTTNLAHIKRLAGVLFQQILQHEAIYGTIEIDIVQRMTPEAREYLKSHESASKKAGE